MDRNGRGSFAVHLVAAAGARPGDLSPALTDALEAHRGRYGADPAGLIVNPSLMEPARAAVDTLGLGDLAVRTSGGCLVWEVWLEVTPAVDGGQPVPRRDSSENAPSARPSSTPRRGATRAGGEAPEAVGLLRRVEEVGAGMTPERARTLAGEQLSLWEAGA